MRANRISGYSKAGAPTSLRSAVQKNCNISDAKYAGDYSLCTYLLKMREYYRWEKGLAFDASLSHEAVGKWVEQRERAWRQLETSSYVPLPMTGRRFDPFDNESINGELLPRGLVYSGGYGRFYKPYFFLGRLLEIERFHNYTVLISAEEYARDLAAPPAMTRGRTIFVRRESIRRMVWECVEEWRWKKRNQAMTRAMAYYDIENDVDAALEQITNAEIETVILHEIGEILASDLLGDAWHDMLRTIARTTAEIVARAIRDHLADCLSTLPALLELENFPSVHLYFANLNGMRKHVYPSLSRAYQQWVETGDLSALKKPVPVGRRHWLSVAQDLLALHRKHGEYCARRIEALALNSCL